MQVKRNAYGRQLGSFHTEAEFKDLGLVPMSFIRAPYVESVSDGVEILSVVDDHIVGVRYGNQVAIAFHPELDSDRKIHQMFLDMIQLKTGECNIRCNLPVLLSKSDSVFPTPMSK